jgi:hypothetical protein
MSLATCEEVVARCWSRTRLLQQLVDEEQAARPRRFASRGIGHADHDLGARAKDIARRELGGETRSA